VMINNLGGVSELELGGVAGETIKWLDAHKINVKRLLVGTYMTSLNMPGFSITLLLLPRADSKATFSAEKILSLLDASTDAPGWKWHATKEPVAFSAITAESKETETVSQKTEVPLTVPEPKVFIDAIATAARGLIAAEPEITRQDQIAGDGDAGLTFESRRGRRTQCHQRWASKC